MLRIEKLKLCAGCRNDYYNRGGHSTTGECWSLAMAEPVERTRVGTWQRPPYDWTPVETLSCHRPEGSVWISVDDVRIRRKADLQPVQDAGVDALRGEPYNG